MRTAIVVLSIVLLAGIAHGGADLFRELPGVTPGPGSGACEFIRGIIDSFAAPGISPMGVDWVESAGVLYHVDEEFGDVFEITPEGASTWLFDIETALGTPGASGNGICYVEERQTSYLYITDWHGHTGSNDAVYKLSLAGSLIDMYPVESFCSGVMGVCFDGASFWLSGDDAGIVVKCDASFSPITTYPHPAGSGGGMDHDPVTGHFYVGDYITGTIYVCDGGMNALDSFSAGWLTQGTLGVSLGRTDRDRTLWVSNFYSDRIYEIDDEFVSPVEDATWGSVKACFR